MKTLLVFHPALAPYRVDFFNYLSDSFAASFYFTTDNLKEQKFDQSQLRSESRFKFNLLDSGFELQSRSIRFEIFGIIKNAKPDIIFCSEYSQITIFVLAYRFLVGGKFKVYTISDDSIDLSVKRKGLRSMVRNMASRYLDGVIFPSKAVGEWYNAYVNPKTKVFELPIVHSNSVFRAKLDKALEGANENVAKFNLQGKKVVLFVGRLVKIKNPEFLIRSFADASKEFKDLVLVIVGAGEERENLEALVQELDLQEKCIFAGRLEGIELYAWYNIAHCLVLPSYKEPYGVVVNEALIAGCKVLCSSMAGSSMLVSEKNGFVFDPHDQRQLTQLLIKASRDMTPVTLPIRVKPDMMPFSFEEKVDTLLSKMAE